MADPNRPAAATPFVAALMLAATAVLVYLPTAAAATTLVLTISTATANPQVPFKNFDGNPAKLFDIDGDGDLEIIAQNDNQYVYVFDSRDGRLLFEIKTRFPPGWGARSFNGPEVAIMSQGGQVRLIVANSAAYVTSLRFDPEPAPNGRFQFVKEWERRMTDCFSQPGMDAKPVLADLDKDGRLDIVIATEEKGVFALRADGTLLWKQCIGGGNAEPGIGDLNRDGFLDVVHVSDGGTISALNGRTGSYLWSFHVPSRFNVGVGSMPVAPTVAQLDGLTGPDVVVGVRDSHDSVDFSKDHALLLALSSGGKLLWGRQDPEGNPLTYTRPIVVDADKDGKPEVYWGDWNTNGHKPPFEESEAWQVTGPGRFYRYDPVGNLVWKQSLGTYWSNKDLALGDVDGDGTQEVLANGPGPTGDGIWYLNSKTGAKKGFVGTHPWKVSRGPLLEDLWGSGTMQVVVQVEAASNQVSGGGILVFDTGQAFDAAWPHVPYPETPAGAPAPPPSPAPFAATFSVPSGVNNWWVEVGVQADRPIVRVDAQVNAGPWTALPATAWGTWAKSFFVATGSQVRFRAFDAGGNAAHSQNFTWLSSPPPPGPFNATFALGSGINNWWVDVKVTATQPVSAVDAQVNGGAWTPLAKTSWGTWAKSFFVATGSQVRFRATDAAGSVALSQNFTWLGTPPPPGPFNATFSVASGINNWWVEVKVTATHPVSTVEAQVGDGAWIALSKTSWGTWAKSVFVASGSEVRFRATSDSDQQTTSSPFVWP